MASQIAQPALARSGSSIDAREDDQYTRQNEDNPLDIQSRSTAQPSSNNTDQANLLDIVKPQHDPDEPPPPYAELDSGPPPPASGPVPIELSEDNSPQLLQHAQPVFSIPGNIAELSNSPLPEVSPVQSPGSPAISSNASLVPAPLAFRTNRPGTGLSQSTVSSGPTSTTFTSAKAREAGFNIEPDHATTRTGSSSSVPSIAVLSATERLQHVREPGKLIAYLIPFPKPRIKGVKVEAMPDRFLIYTPPLPPLSKPAPGEKESQWHKTRRLWQEDVRKATVGNASMMTWKGMKARSTILIGKSVSMSRSSSVEFLDRAAQGAITSTVDEVDAEQGGELNTPTTPEAASPVSTPASTPAATPSVLEAPMMQQTSPVPKDAKPKTLEELILIFPPSLDSPAEKIRTEFTDTLLRAREKSRKEAAVASSLFPIAAAIDASVIITFGGLSEISGVWAYTNIQGAKASKRMTEGLALGEVKESEEDDVQGCTCGHHHDSFGPQGSVPKDKGKKKKTGTGINLRMQKSNHLEILRRYLDLACLNKDYSMFPMIQEAAGDVTEETCLAAIGWEPTRRQGIDLDMELKNKVERITPEQDEMWQVNEAKEDLRRIFKKAANEWIAWCKLYAKDAEAALKK